MKVIKSPVITNIFSLGSAKAITLAPFGVFYKGDDLSDKTLSHETCHWKQQLAYLIVPFYALYLIEFFILFLKWFLTKRKRFPLFVYHRWKAKEIDSSFVTRIRAVRYLAYKTISFEKEATTYAKAKDDDRGHVGFLTNYRY
jgi:hypothetical protein